MRLAAQLVKLNCARLGRRLLLLLASLFFYAFGRLWDLPILLASAVLHYGAGRLLLRLRRGRKAVVAGVDLSRSALRRAARRGEGCRFAVASVYHLPLADGAAQVLVDCFSPLALEEFRRVLAPGGLFLYVVPARDHLWQLKEVLYPTPYPNPQEDIPYGGFAYEAVEEVDSWMDLGDNQTIRDLFTMTPYRWRTPRQGMERLAQLEGLRVKAAFRIHVFRRQG